MLPSSQFAGHGIGGTILWYIHEVYTRAAYYQLLLSHVENITFHDIVLSDITKQQGADKLFQAMKLATKQDEIQLPSKVNNYDSGRRLATCKSAESLGLK